MRAVPVGIYAEQRWKSSAHGPRSSRNCDGGERARFSRPRRARRSPLGIVYETDAKVEPGVKIVGAFPDDSHPPIIYPVALTVNAKPDTAAVSRTFARRPRKRVREYGFTVRVKSTRERVKPWHDELIGLCSNLARSMDRVRLSLRIAIVATAVALPFGVSVAGLLARKNSGQGTGRRHRLPALVLPPVVTGYCCSSRSAAGTDGAILDHYFGIDFRSLDRRALAYGIMGFPLMVRPIRLSLEAIDRRLEDAAATLAQTTSGSSHRHLAARAPRCDRRRRLLCQGARRIRRHHHVRVQHSWRDFRRFRRRSTPSRRFPMAMPRPAGWR